MLSCDFTTYYINNVTPGQAMQLYAQGYRCVQLGFDSQPSSGQVLASLLGAGFLWDAYKFLYWDQDVSQVQSCIDGIHLYSPDEAHLPSYLFFDAEENTKNGLVTLPAPTNTTDYFHRLRQYVESKGITPNDKVKPGIYSRPGWWNQYVPSTYTELSDNEWVLWNAGTFTPYGGWTRAIGNQNQENVDSPVGNVDVSTFDDRGANHQPVPPTPKQIYPVQIYSKMSDGSLVTLWTMP